jgi:alpha-tubulin suppressor-like RCC1 family protein
MAGENGTGGVVVGTGGSSVSVPCSPGAVVVKAIAAGQAHTCVLLTSGKVRCWGTNNQGQLGDGTTRSRDINRKPMVDVLTGVQEIATGSWHSCALMTTSGVRCWGENSEGQLGDGTTTNSLSPPTSDVLTGVQAITAGELHTCALTSTGGVRCWGYNTYGQLGDSTTTNCSSPPTSDVLTGVQAITAGYEHTCALMTTGGVRCWGQNSQGQLGDSTTIDRSTPTPVPGTCQ